MSAGGLSVCLTELSVCRRFLDVVGERQKWNISLFHYRFTGQLVGAISFFLLGFVPGYVLSCILNKAGMLRYSEAILEKGVDSTEGETQAYPDFQKSS